MEVSDDGLLAIGMMILYFIYGHQESLLICLGSLVGGHISGALFRERETSPLFWLAE